MFVCTMEPEKTDTLGHMIFAGRSAILVSAWSRVCKLYCNCGKSALISAAGVGKLKIKSFFSGDHTYNQP